MLVTGDEDLLEAANKAPLPILTPRGFWERLRTNHHADEQRLLDGSHQLRAQFKAGSVPVLSAHPAYATVCGPTLSGIIR